MDQKIYDQINDAINDRSSWESKMSSYYDMRFDGIRRAVKPYTDAPDVHYALGDTIVEKLKPFYAQQLYADQVLATFVAQDPVPRDQVTLVEQWNDYKLKQCTNFERAMMNGIDMMLHYGFCPFKIYWNNVKKEVAFEAIDPMYVIVPKTTDVAGPPDWLVHVKIVSRAQYLADKQYKRKDKDFIDSIVGSCNSNPSGTTAQKEQSQRQREGLNSSIDRNRIVIWECWSNTPKGWLVDTISPVKGADDSDLRDPFISAYKNGKNGESLVPIVCLRNEETTKGWYSPRGILELVFTHEMALNKLWNSELQFLDFFGMPTYKNDGLAPINADSFKARPGSILPQGVAPNIPTSAPVDFNIQMQFVRALAEDRIQIPDIGAGEHLTGKRNQKGDVTAEQIKSVLALSSQSNDLRARLFRMQLSDIYNQAWALLKQYDSKDSSFIAEGQYLSMPVDLREKQYSIHPSGSADSWNKAYRVQDATMTYQMLLGKPNVDQDALLDYFLEAKDPRLKQRLHMNSGFSDSLQGERQAMELLMMEAGYPPVIKPDDKDAVHLAEIPQWMNLKMAKQQLPSAGTAKLVAAHIQQHGQQAAQKQDKQAMMEMKNIGPTMNILQAIMAAGGMQDPQAGQNGQAGAPSDKRPSMSINYKDAPDSIKRQMEAMEGFQPAIGEASPDDNKLAVTAATKSADVAAKVHATATNAAAKKAEETGQSEGESSPAAPSKPAAPAQPPQLHVHIPESITHHMPAPVVHVPAPVVNVPAPVVNVHPTPVNVQHPAINVHPTPVHVHPTPINMPALPASKEVSAQQPSKKGKRKVTVVRDASGRITGAETEESD